jgi:NAD(P)H dehydrogenase (quinone)
MTNILIAYYSTNGTTYKLAQALAAGAETAGAEVRLRRAKETAPQAAVDSRPAWGEHLASTDHLEVPTHDDLRWADGILIGTPTRYGNVATQISAFIESTGPLWYKGELSGKTGGGFVTSSTIHGGHESTLFPIYHVLVHWGAIIVPPGYVGQPLLEAGNPYGSSALATQSHTISDMEESAAVEYGKRFATITEVLARAKETVSA